MPEVERVIQDVRSVQDAKKAKEALSYLEDETPVGILEFIDSPDYLNMADFIYPAGKWMLKTFYEPWDCYENYTITWRGEDYEFPGMKYQGLTEEETKAVRYNKMVAVIGQRFGKSVISAICVLYELYKLLCMPDPTKVVDGLAPNSPITISVGATSQTQSKDTVWAYVERFRDNAPWFQRYIDKAKALKVGGKSVYAATTIHFEFRHKNVTVGAVHAKSGTLRGATRICVVMDEISHFDDGAKNNADNVYDALDNSLQTFKDKGIAIIISSPLHIADKACRLYAACGTKFESDYYEEMGWEPLTEYNGEPIFTDKNMLGFHFPTWDVNPFMPYETFDQKFKVNPESTRRDFGACPSNARDAFFSNPAKIDSIFDKTKSCLISPEGQIDTKRLVPKPGIRRYHVHVDVGAGRPSNFGLALGHSEKRTRKNPDGTMSVVPVSIVDLVYAVKSDEHGEMNYKLAREILDYIIDKFPSITYSSDGWNDLEYSNKIRKKVSNVLSVVLNIDHYTELKTQIYSDRVECHDYPLLGSELKRLEVVNGSQIKKGDGFTKDVSDCVAAIVSRMTDVATKNKSFGRSAKGALS